MARSRAYNRDVSVRKALRKRRIAKEVYPDGKEHPYYSNLHQYSKNKIHCSCPICSAKTKNKGKHRKRTSGWNPEVNYKPADLRRQEAMNQDEAIFETENDNE